MKDNPNKHHIGFILNKINDMYITSPLNITEELFVSLPKLSVKEMLIKWMNSNIQNFAQLSKVYVCNKHNTQIEGIYHGRYEFMNILSYVDFAKTCNVINNFTKLNHNFMKERITFPLLYS